MYSIKTIKITKHSFCESFIGARLKKKRKNLRYFRATAICSQFNAFLYHHFQVRLRHRNVTLNVIYAIWLWYSFLKNKYLKIKDHNLARFINWATCGIVDLSRDPRPRRKQIQDGWHGMASWCLWRWLVKWVPKTSLSNFRYPTSWLITVLALREFCWEKVVKILKPIRNNVSTIVAQLFVHIFRISFYST